MQTYEVKVYKQTCEKNKIKVPKIRKKKMTVRTYEILNKAMFFFLIDTFSGNLSLVCQYSSLGLEVQCVYYSPLAEIPQIVL